MCEIILFNWLSLRLPSMKENVNDMNQTFRTVTCFQCSKILIQNINKKYTGNQTKKININ